MAEARYRLPRTDSRYGHVCPECACPKTVQAARCAACYRDALLAGLARSGPANPNWRGGYVRRSRATGASSGRPQPQSHPWRALIGRDVAAAKQKRAA